jgi:membrane-associated phospholipid phosphatase
VSTAPSSTGADTDAGTALPASASPASILLGSLAKVSVLALGAVIWVWTYSTLNARGAAPGRAAMFTPPLAWAPGLYMPWMAWIYVVGGYLLCWVPYAWNWSWPRLLRVMATYAAGSCVLFLIYFVWPVAILRPSYDSGLAGESLMRQVIAVDRPANCFPSSHAYMSAAAAFLVWRSTRRTAVRWTVAAAAALVIVSTITVGQHYLMDAIAGVAVAWACVYVISPRAVRRT